MATKLSDSRSSVGKEEVYHSMVGKTAHKIHLEYPPQVTRTDEVDALARRVFLKFDLFLVLPMLIMFCKCDVDYKH